MERTREELADALDEDWHMCADDRCRADRHEAARRLREMPDGEHIEGCKIVGVSMFTPRVEVVLELPADVSGPVSGNFSTLILHPQEPKK